MKFSKSILNLFAEFKELPFGRYIIRVYYNTTTGVREHWFANFTERDGLSLNCREFFSLEEEFTFEIYSEDFMENALSFYNHELEANL